MVGVAVKVTEAPEHDGLEPDVIPMLTDATGASVKDTGSEAIPFATT